jgi:hypothetical protein
MTEQEYKRSYKDDDDAAKLFREDEPIKCKICKFELEKHEHDTCGYCEYIMGCLVHITN